MWYGLLESDASLYGYSEFVNNPETYWTHTLRMTKDPKASFDPSKLNPNKFKHLSNNGSGYYNGELTSCYPYIGDNGCNAVCATNVHII